MLEIRAILLGLQSLCPTGCHVRVMTDNTTALAYVKHQGGVRSLECNEEAQRIWSWAEGNQVWISIAHVPGIFNEIADFHSRNFADNLEWSLNDRIFNKIVKIFGQPDVDLFATRLNAKTEKYISWRPDPGAIAVDAFSIQWNDFNLFYAFPPFSVVTRTIEKALEEKARGLLVVPHWPSQAWWGRLVNVCPRLLQFRSKQNNLLPQGNPDNKEFLHKIPLVACLFLGSR